MYLNPQFIKTLPPNVDGRDFVIGDLHGCYDEVEQLLSFVNFNTTFDRLFSTGDLIDRGPKSIECLSLLRKPWFYAILGNHEELALNKIKSLRLGQIKNISPIELDYLARIEDFLHELTELPLAYEIEQILFDKAYIVHAEILPEHLFDVNPEQLNTQEYDKYFDSLQKYDLSQSINKFFQDYKENELNYNLKQKLLWSRKIVTSFYKKNQADISKGNFSFLRKAPNSNMIKIFSGHNVVPFPIKIGQQYYIDTGAALGYSPKEISSPTFTQFGHKFFALSMVEISTGACYGCITNSAYRGQIVKLEESIYDRYSKPLNS